MMHGLANPILETLFLPLIQTPISTIICLRAGNLLAFIERSIQEQGHVIGHKLYFLHGG